MAMSGLAVTHVPQKSLPTVKSMTKTNYFFLTFLKIASNGLPDGQDGQVGAGDSSHVDPDGLNQC